MCTLEVGSVDISMFFQKLHVKIYLNIAGPNIFLSFTEVEF